MSCPGSPGPKAQVRALPREPSCPGRLLYTFCQDMALQVCWVFWYESLCFFLAELSELGMMFLLGDWGSLRAGLCRASAHSSSFGMRIISSVLLLLTAPSPRPTLGSRGEGPASLQQALPHRSTAGPHRGCPPALYIMDAHRLL